jgi:hypothetical protein
VAQIPACLTTACIANSSYAPAIDLDLFRRAGPNLPVKSLHTQRTLCQVTRIARDQIREVLRAAKRLDRAAVRIFGNPQHRAVPRVRVANAISRSYRAADGDQGHVDVPAPRAQRDGRS